MTYICMGDSITYGFGLEDLKDRWTDLAAQWTGHTFVNCGVSGDTTAGMLARCQRQVFCRQADAMILLGGINDISILGDWRGASLNVISMFRQAQAEGLPVILGLPLPIVPRMLTAPDWEPDRDMERIGEGCRQYDSWLRQYAAANGIPVIDFPAAFRMPEGMPNGELFLDGLHPNQAGHRLMAEAVCRTLAELETNR